MEPDSRFLHFIYLNIYGVPVILDEALEGAYYEGDTSKFNNIGRLTGYYIPFEEILEGGEDPVDVCDAASADLEFVASIIQDYYEENESICSLLLCFILMSWKLMSNIEIMDLAAKYYKSSLAC
ncbi:MAG TPA: hypothetical protein VM577_11415 [Anaerovoracaceae bacterium]|nr:hypothetical protein [Anaerovoracaceae bacterium]